MTDSGGFSFMGTTLTDEMRTGKVLDTLSRGIC